MDNVKKFRWTVEIEVDEREVADGINLSKPNLLYFALLRGFPYAIGESISVKVKKAPKPEEIENARGWGEK